MPSQKTLLRLLMFVFGFAVSVVVVTALPVILLLPSPKSESGMTLWAVIFIGSGLLGGWRASLWHERVAAWLAKQTKEFFRRSRLTRAVLTGSLFWVVAVSLYFVLLHDFSYGFAQKELILVLGWIFSPPAVLLLGYWSYIKLVLPGSRE